MRLLTLVIEDLRLGEAQVTIFEGGEQIGSEWGLDVMDAIEKILGERQETTERSNT